MPINTDMCKRCIREFDVAAVADAKAGRLVTTPIWHSTGRRNLTTIRSPHTRTGNKEYDSADIFINCPYASDVRLAGEPPSSCPYITEQVVSDPKEIVIPVVEPGLMEEVLAQSVDVPEDFEQEI
jgi:hypothetical protein